jgi:hypothetical protein
MLNRTKCILLVSEARAASGRQSIVLGLGGCSLLVIVVLADDLHVVSHQVGAVEADSKLADEVDVASLLHLLQEGCACGAGTRQVSLREAAGEERG